MNKYDCIFVEENSNMVGDCMMRRINSKCCWLSSSIRPLCPSYIMICVTALNDVISVTSMQRHTTCEVGTSSDANLVWITFARICMPRDFSMPRHVAFPPAIVLNIRVDPSPDPMSMTTDESDVPTPSAERCTCSLILP